MRNRLLSILFGTLMGLSLSLLIWVLFAEHLTLFILVPILPLIGVMIGLILGWLRKIPAPKAWISLLIFTIIIGISIGYTELRWILLRARREQITSMLSMQYPDSRVIAQRYRSGNGMEEPPNVTVLIESNGAYEEITRFYDAYLKQHNWQRHGGAWRKHNYEIFLHNKSINSLKTSFELRVDFLGSWMTHFSKI